MTEWTSPGLDDLPDHIGRYDVRAVVGVGGFAIVVRAYDAALDDDAAIKVLSSRSASVPDLRERFLAEARLLRRVRHPNVIAVHDIGELDDGRPYLVMDYATGGTLEERMPSSSERCTANDVELLTGALAGGLHALHREGVVHRDVKPANVLVHRTGAEDIGSTAIQRGLICEDERLIVGDLGMAKDQHRTSVGPTVTGGTPHFRAPEQSRHGEITPGADVYGATGVIWQLLAGTLPPLPATLAGQLSAVPPEWRQFFEHGFAFEPEDRYASMPAWREAALACLAGGVRAPTEQTDSPVGFVPSAPGATCPYKGLAAFQPEDAPFFFGRERLIDELVARLRAHRVLVIGGPSGSGKSSLLRAGLVPAVRSGALPGGNNWPVALFTPGPTPLEELHDRLAASGRTGLPTVSELRSDPASIRQAASGDGILLAIDQFEELFTQQPSLHDRELFVAALRHLVEPIDSSVRVAVAIRADFYGVCAHHPWLAAQINQNQVLVGPMSPTELRSAIVDPAEGVGLRIEDRLVDTIVDEAGAESGSLPLVAHALMETWLRRRGNTLTLSGFDAAGGVAGAIAQSAESAFQAMDDEHRDAVHDVMLRLITPGDGAADTRARLDRSEFEADVATAEVVSEFVAARLLTSDETTIEVAHERLIESWPRLQGWISEARDDLRRRQRLDRLAAEWDSSGEIDDLLARGTPLATFTELSDRMPGQIGPRSRAFLDRSIAHEEAKRAAAEEAEHRQRRVRRVAIVSLATLTFAALVATVFAVIALGVARSNERVAQLETGNAIGSASQAIAASDPLLGLNLAAESVARVDEPSAAARAGLVISRQTLGVPGAFIPTGRAILVGDALTATLLPDGSAALVGDRDGVITVFDQATRSGWVRLVGHEGAIQEIAVSRDGLFAASSDDRGDIWLWNLADLPPPPPAPPTPDTGRPEAIEVSGRPLGTFGRISWSVAFSPDGREIAASAENGVLRRFDRETAAPLSPDLLVENADLLSVAYGDDELFIGTGDGQVLVWDPTSDDPPVTIDAHGSDDVWEMIADLDGGRLLTVGTDRAVRIWDLETKELRTVAFDRSIEGPAVDRPSGLTIVGENQLAIGDGTGRLHQWDLASGQPTSATGRLHQDLIIDASSSADGSIVVTLSDDQRLRFLQRGFAPAVTTTVAEAKSAYALAVRADGEVTALGHDDGSIVLRNRAGDVVGELLDRSGTRITELAFANAALVSANASGGLRVWDVDGRQVTSEHEDPSSTITDLGVSPSGERVIVATDSRAEIRLVEGLQLETEFPIRSGTVAAFRSDDEVVASDGLGLLRRFGLDGSPRGDQIAIDPMAEIRSIDVRSDGRLVAAATADEEVVIWDLDEDVAINQLAPHPSGALDVAFAPDGLTLVATSQTGLVRFWDHRVDEGLGEPLELHDGPAFVAIDELGWIVTAGLDGRVTSSDLLDIDMACALASWTFELEQQRQYLGESEPMGCELTG